MSHKQKMRIVKSSKKRVNFGHKIKAGTSSSSSSKTKKVKIKNTFKTSKPANKSIPEDQVRGAVEDACVYTCNRCQVAKKSYYAFKKHLQQACHSSTFHLHFTILISPS